MFIQCFFDSSPKYELKELCISHLSLNNSGLKQYTYITSQQLTDSAIQVLFCWVLGFQSITGCSQLKAPLWRILFESHWRIQFSWLSCSFLITYWPRGPPQYLHVSFSMGHPTPYQQVSKKARSTMKSKCQQGGSHSLLYPNHRSVIHDFLLHSIFTSKSLGSGNSQCEGITEKYGNHQAEESHGSHLERLPVEIICL